MKCHSVPFWRMSSIDPNRWDRARGIPSIALQHHRWCNLLNPLARKSLDPAASCVRRPSLAHGYASRIPSVSWHQMCVVRRWTMPCPEKPVLMVKISHSGTFRLTHFPRSCYGAPTSSRRSQAPPGSITSFSVTSCDSFDRGRFIRSPRVSMGSFQGCFGRARRR